MCVRDFDRRHREVGLGETRVPSPLITKLEKWDGREGAGEKGDLLRGERRGGGGERQMREEGGAAAVGGMCHSSRDGTGSQSSLRSQPFCGLHVGRARSPPRSVNTFYSRQFEGRDSTATPGHHPSGTRRPSFRQDQLEPFSSLDFSAAGKEFRTHSIKIPSCA